MSLVHIHIGGTGVRMAESVWDCLAAEYGLDVTGKQTRSSVPSPFYFSETGEGLYRSRAVFVDLEPEPTDSLKYMKLFREESKVKSDEGGAFASRGLYTAGKEIREPALRAIEKAVDDCDNFGGFLLYCSMLGGTGSGLSNLLTRQLRCDYPKKLITALALFPSESSNIVVEPYNLFLCEDLFTEGDLTIALNNDGLYQSVSSDDGNYRQVNEAVAQIVATMNSPVTHESWNRMDLGLLKASLVSHSRINVVIPTLTPLRQPNTSQTLFSLRDPAASRSFQSTLLINSAAPLTAWDIEDRLASPSQCFDVATRTRPLWRDWQAADSSSLLLDNNVAIARNYSHMAEQWDSLYYKRAFVWWYVGEGLESGEMSEVRENMESLIHEYKVISEPSQHSESSQYSEDEEDSDTE